MVEQKEPECPTYTDVSQLPLVLRLDDFCAVTQRKAGGVRRELEKGTCVPAPFARHPYRWRKDDIVRWLQEGDRMKTAAGSRTRKRAS